ncbi:MAG: hypothetical protein II889_12360 [Clostridia bacterium]|nr:hypothetical protein [Clostridia bacterium]
MKTKKILSLLLAALMLCLSFAACSESKENTDAETPSAGSEVATPAPETEAETEKVTAESTLTIEDFGGREYRMISTNQDNRQVDIIAEEMTGATLNDLVFGRNSRVSDLYNITMTAEQADYSAINTMVQKDAKSGDMSYDLYLTNYTANGLASNGVLYDFYQLPSVQLDMAWWDQNEKNDLTIMGKLFMAIGDISPTELLTSECMLFNKRLFDNHNIAYPYPDALEGTWTLDKCFGIANGLTEDLNGDGEIKVDDDLFSLTCWYDYGTACLYGAGGDFSHVDENGQVVLDIDLEKIVNIYEKLWKLFIDAEANYETAQHERSFKVFNEGRAYFCGITFQKIETFLRDMEDDYGVLPNPKYDENQANYSTCVSGAGSMVVVPVSCTDPHFVGTMMEAMAAVSYDMITPDLIHVLASTKNVRDEESSQIVQMIIRNRNHDTARNHDIQCDRYVENMIPKKDKEVASFFAKNEKLWNKNVEKLNNSYAKLAEGGN